MTWLALALEEPQHDESGEPRHQDENEDEQARVDDLQHAFMLTVAG
jgi:hypothetical protein